MLDHFLKKFPNRAHEVICAYIVILGRDELKPRVAGIDIEKHAKLAPLELIWHLEDVSVTLTRSRSDKVTSPVTCTHTGPEPTDSVGQPLTETVTASAIPREWNWKQKVAFHDELNRPEDHVEGYSWLNCGWDRYG